MELTEIKKAIQAKAVELETAMEDGKPHNELLKIYKELKDLQFQQLQAALEIVTE